MFKKLVERVPVGAADPVSDLIGLIDLIEMELGLSTGGKSVRNRLSDVISEIRRSEGVASQESVSVCSMLSNDWVRLSGFCPTMVLRLALKLPTVDASNSACTTSRA